jgi:hypothetical protein
MNHLKRCMFRLATSVLLLAGMPAAVYAAPGAHGPDGEHLDGPAVAGSIGTSPRMEAASELFELVATLAGGELSILIDRFETNEPVLGAKVEVESGSTRATARFHADHGDYAVDDPALLKRLEQPGQHPLVIAVVSGTQSDLLNGTLSVTAASLDAAHGHSHGDEAQPAASRTEPGWVRPAAIAAIVAALAAAAWGWRRRSRGAAATAGEAVR